MDEGKSALTTRTPAAPRITTNRQLVPPLLCFSHLRWNFVYQRPQHLMTRAAQDRRVVFWEEPIQAEPGEDAPRLALNVVEGGVTVATPVLPPHYGQSEADAAQRLMLNRLTRAYRLQDAVLWFYTPAALSFAAELCLRHTVVYDCMDELSAFLGADPSLPQREQVLLNYADVVFTGGFSLYEAKRHQHNNVHPFPSGVDLAHFRPARKRLPDPQDQRGILTPRLGFYGVIDERLDIPLLAEIAAARPDWQLVLVGPVVKIDRSLLPQADNIHYLGGKDYRDLPVYLSNWNVALMPFARNDATHFISPTKTPEYLAGGKPVVSTPIPDVVRHYGHATAVRIAASAEDFIKGVEEMLLLSEQPVSWLPKTDEMLAASSWNNIWDRMSGLITAAAARRETSVSRERAQVS
ncbi:MAG: glycosyltransferase family 1 protein [Rhodopila sp.]